MKISMFNNNKIFNKKLLLNKEKGENIIIGGGDGAGRCDILLSLFNQLIKTNQIDKSSIWLNLEGNVSLLYRLVALLEGYNISVEDNFFFFNGMNPHPDFEGEHTFFSSVDFKNRAIQDFVKDRHVLTVTNSLYNPKSDAYKDVLYNAYNFIENLPVNNGKEIPIFIDHISDLKSEDFYQYIRLIEIGNKKGYFFITSTYGMFNLESFDRHFPILQETHRHFLIANSQINLDNKFIEDIKFKEPLKYLIPGMFYYLKDFELQNKEAFAIENHNIKDIHEFPKIYTQNDLIKL